MIAKNLKLVLAVLSLLSFQISLNSLMAQASDEAAIETADTPVPFEDKQDTVQEKTSVPPVLSSISAEDMKKAEDLKNSAHTYFKEKKFDIAIMKAEDAIGLNPAFANDLNGLIVDSKKQIDSNPVLVSDLESMQRDKDLAAIRDSMAPILSGEVLDKAYALADDGKFDEAQKILEDAKKKFDNEIEKLSGPPSDILKSKVDRAIAHAKVKLSVRIKDVALGIASEKNPDPKMKDSNPDAYYDAVKLKYERVKTVLREAIQENPSTADRLNGLIESCNDKIESAEFKKITDLEHTDPEKPLFNMDPERPVRQYEMDVSLKQAQILLDNEEYILARNALEKIIARDPYNLKAMSMLGNLYQKLFQIGKLRAYNSTLERLTETRWKWNEPVMKSPAIKPELDTSVSKSSNTELYEKLNQLVVDHMDFDDAPISSVVNWLIIKSREIDPSKVGINIMLPIKPEIMNSIPKITMNFDNIPIGELIRYICLNCGLKYKVEQHAVIVSNEITNTMETRFFKARAKLISSIAPQEAGNDEEKNNLLANEDFFSLEDGLIGDGGDQAAAGTRRSVTSDALIAYFSERGVPFPEGSSIAYNRISSKLTVTNTPENLRRLENLLRELDIETPLVLIESKFVEITQNDLEDLSFEWIFSKDVSQTNPGDNSSWWQVLPNASTTRPLGTNMSGVISPVDGAVNDRLVNNLVFPGFGPRKNMHLTMMLHALDQSSRAEVLSAPKVIATSGQEAMIRMVREEYYPTSWTEPSVAVTNGIFQITPPEPDLGEATDVGVILICTPTVSPNNYTITLQLNPQVVELSGWTDNFYTLVIGVQGSSANFNLKMPEIARRDALTTVKVYDGETIVLGGMVRENVDAVDDSIPFLGEIPVVGRLARSKNSKSVKRNLLIFVTARLINPDGAPVRELEGKGLPDFGR